MKKPQYDALQKVRKFVVDVDDAISHWAGKAQLALDAVDTHVMQFTSEVLDKIDEALEESPLEDPVVPTGPYDNVRDFAKKGMREFVPPSRLTREQKIAKIAETVPAWSDAEYAATKSDRDVDVAYLSTMITNNIFGKFKP